VPDSRKFEETILRHLDAAYNLASWLLKSPTDAEDVVQDACTRAFRFFDSFRGGDARAWLLTIVRRTAYDTLRGRERPVAELDTVVDPEPGPEEIALHHIDAARIRAAIEALPVEYREVVVLRELEGLPYKDISDIAGVPLGTVMSRLSRARRRLQAALLEEARR